MGPGIIYALGTCTRAFASVLIEAGQQAPSFSSAWTIAGAVIAGAGIPSAVVGIMVGRINKRIADRDAEREKKDQARIQSEIMTRKLIMASISLGEATAEAVQRIPDAHCNGDMHAALEFAKTAKEEYRDFEHRITAETLN